LIFDYAYLYVHISYLAKYNIVNKLNTAMFNAVDDVNKCIFDLIKLYWHLGTYRKNP